MPDSNLYNIAVDFDKSFCELKFLVESEKLAIERELKHLRAPERREAIMALHDTMLRVDQEIKTLRANLTNNVSAVALESKFYEILARRNRSETVASLQPGTPIKQCGEATAPTTPEEPKRMDFDFTDYPSTPTLDQIGLSGKAMALVGRGQDTLSNSMSDAEYDNSFFQKSPSVLKTSANDSFSSIGSVPNFHALNSSPSSHIPTGPHNLTQVTCAFDSGTDENSFNGTNNSFADPSGKDRNVVINNNFTNSTLQK